MGLELGDHLSAFSSNNNKSGIMDLNQTDEQLLIPQHEVKGIELSRVSGDLAFSEQEDDESDKVDFEA